MGSLSTTEQRKMAYFHSLSKSMTENSQAIFQSKYKSSHSIRMGELWSDDIAYAKELNDAISESVTNSAITYYEDIELDMIYGSNGQAYSYILDGTFKDDSYPILERGQVTDGGIFIRPFIAPVDIPQKDTNEPSYGYDLRLFRGLDAVDNPGAQIYPTEGAWSIDSYSGIIHFGENNTPSDLGWGTIRASFFHYSGLYGSTGTINVDDETLKHVDGEIRGSKVHVQYGNVNIGLGVPNGDTNIVLEHDPIADVNVYVNGVYYPVSRKVNAEEDKPFYFMGQPLAGSILYVNTNYLDYELSEEIDLLSVQYNYVEI